MCSLGCVFKNEIEQENENNRIKICKTKMGIVKSRYWLSTKN